MLLGLASDRLVRRRFRVLVLMLACGIAVCLLALSSPVVAKPVAVSCPAQLPVMTAPGWSAARGELVPPGAVAGQVCLAGAHGRFIRASGLTQQLARDLAAALDAIPAANPAAPADCATVSPSEVLITFGYRTGRVLQVEAELGGCSVVTNGAVSRNATGRFDHVIGDLAFLIGGSPPPIPALVKTRGSPELLDRDCAASPAERDPDNDRPGAARPVRDREHSGRKVVVRRLRGEPGRGPLPMQAIRLRRCALLTLRLGCSPARR